MDAMHYIISQSSEHITKPATDTVHPVVMCNVSNSVSLDYSSRSEHKVESEPLVLKEAKKFYLRLYGIKPVIF